MMSRTFALLAAACLSGCAAFRTGPETPISPWPPIRAAHRPSVSLLIESTSEPNGGEVGPIFTVWREQTVRAYRDSGLFSEVQVGLQKRDWRAHVTIGEKGEFSRIQTMLMGATLGLIPADIRQDFSVTTEFTDANGAVVAKFAREESNHFVIQLFMLFLMPFRYPRHVIADIIYDLNRATLIEARQDTRLWQRP